MALADSVINSATFSLPLGTCNKATAS